ncbi:MAG: hypothetical protein QM605_16870, partial [Sphingobium sp.]
MAAVISTHAMAQEAPQSAGGASSDDIIVTAQRRSERLVDVPVSVNAISNEEMQTKQINSVFDLGKSVTSLRFEGQVEIHAARVGQVDAVDIDRHARVERAAEQQRADAA